MTVIRGRRPPLRPALREFTTTIFAEMSALAVATASVNLGQGFPDTDGPAEVAEAAVAAIRAGVNQYPPGRGAPDLLAAIAEHQRRFYGLDYDPDTEVLVTAGATEAIAAAVLALCEPGDEVVMFEPYYDSYPAVTAMAGATRRVVPLRPPGWGFDAEELRAALSGRARVLLLNSPHNPTGAVFPAEALATLARLCTERDVIVVTDEVYEHLVFDGAHVPIATLPGMRERTITVSSAGKTFSFTGWKVGWACAPAELIDAVRAAKQFLTFVNGAPFQPAIAAALRLPDSYYASFAAGLRERRDRLAAGLADLGFDVLPTAGTYFLTTDIRSLTDADALTFCLSLPQRCGVVGIPTSAFYDDPARGGSLVRWAFCKRPEVLDEAVRRLGRLRG